MSRLNLVFLGFFVHGCMVVESTTRSPRWHPPLIWNDGKEPIGRGITLNAHIFYDNKTYETQAPGNNVTQYFKNLFDRTQQHFNNRSVMISIVVRNISRNTSLEVKKNRHVLNGTATIKNLQNYSEVFTLSNDSIVYLFTNKTPYDNSYVGAAIPGVSSRMSTFGTFCTENNSAAIVVLDPGSTSYLGTVKATAEVFGSKTFDKFKQDDFMKMKETFLHCHVNKTQNAESEEED
uniref:28 kDa Metastriate family member n=1 Tax=Rhipicephalus zambeziensis TaxID=60191 RepID=A0A224Y0U1_9ACAR